MEGVCALARGMCPGERDVPWREGCALAEGYSMYVKTQIRPFPSTASSSRDATSMISVKFAISGCYVAATLRLSLECLQLLLLALLPASSCLWLLLATTSGDYVAVAAAADDDDEWRLCLGQGEQVKSATAQSRRKMRGHRKSEVLAVVVVPFLMRK